MATELTYTILASFTHVASILELALYARLFG